MEWQLQGVVAHKWLVSLHITLCIRNSLPNLPNIAGVGSQVIHLWEDVVAARNGLSSQPLWKRVSD